MKMIKVEKQASAMQLVQAIASSWGSNEMLDFRSLFAQDATIIHPFFQNPISPKIAADVLNATVCGTTTYRGFVLQKGVGDGNKDVIEMYFDETGKAANYNPSYIGRMAVKAEIVNHKFTKLSVYGYELINQFPTRVFPLQRINVGLLTTQEITAQIADAWGTNDMQSFISLFTEDALIMHPLFKDPITPEIAADVLNSAMRGTTIPKDLKLITGNGSGEYDIANMYFYETGQECGYTPDVAGIMHVTAKIICHRIKELYVHGYSPIPSQAFTQAAMLLEPSFEQNINCSDQQALEVKDTLEIMTDKC